MVEAAGVEPFNGKRGGSPERVLEAMIGRVLIGHAAESSRVH